MLRLLGRTMHLSYAAGGSSELNPEEPRAKPEQERLQRLRLTMLKTTHTHKESPDPNVIF